MHHEIIHGAVTKENQVVSEVYIFLSKFQISTNSGL